ncbi:cytosolic Fe-S cluster assembly factor NUBP2 [Thamnocephalis sphaerospora]|uniref:Cytosolic Fe-S cluster assembly factor NUBP2 n=1 Tax=Thamnocephalis sphaerospora TaxID=78915 RepID=A0A4P9XUR6_9FUNG|nr:cytosolic Fe-S cluster assembly factor NUBP2 [Thamnocephalis sphaerospora]|eukprot:RKP09190.1 cytosolic Fe-S cluster assembly factor NUBP2 [Thamnocephalis sphaerospora]
MSSKVAERLASVENVLLVLSGKGGVGKSTVSVRLARSLVRLGYRVGVLDVDLCGPSVPLLLGVSGRQVHQATQGWVPVFTDETQRLCCMSIGFLLQNQDDAVVWRGPKKNAMIRQFLSDVCWGELDYLIVDTPPGTSDEHLAVIENLKEYKPNGAVVVTTPQASGRILPAVALSDVRKELTFCRTVELPVIGVVENMSGYVCPHCAECANVFSSGGGEAIAEEFNVPFLSKQQRMESRLNCGATNTRHGAARSSAY